MDASSEPSRPALKILITLVIDESLTDRRNGGPTDGRTYPANITYYRKLFYGIHSKTTGVGGFFLNVVFKLSFL